MEQRLWAVVLAGGAGTRLASVTGGVPKQFWQPEGGPTLLDETLTRLAPLVPSERCVIVIDEAHREFLGRCALGAARVVAQPGNRGTAVGVLYGLLSVLAVEPQAVVLITPADHGVVNRAAFLSAIRNGISRVASSGEIMLFGAAPSTAHTDHGWITASGGASQIPVQRVATFVEKPKRDTARELLKSGALVNTMIVAGWARSLLRMCQEHVPDAGACFVSALTLPPDVADEFVRTRYPRLPTSDFSRDVLTGASDLLVYRIPADAGWSDLGTPERAASWLEGRAKARHASRGSQTSNAPAKTVERVHA